MLRRTTAALAAAAVLSFGLASATSLGVFDPPVASGATDDVTPCHVPDPTTNVSFFDGLIGSLLQLLLVDLTGLLDADYIRLSNDLAGDCDGMRPVVIVIGDHDADSGTPDQVLARIMLAEISNADKGSSTYLHIPDDSSDDELDALLGLLGSTIPNEVRISFCPVGATVCEP